MWPLYIAPEFPSGIIICFKMCSRHVHYFFLKKFHNTSTVSHVQMCAFCYTSLLSSPSLNLHLMWHLHFLRSAQYWAMSVSQWCPFLSACVPLYWNKVDLWPLIKDNGHKPYAAPSGLVWVLTPWCMEKHVSQTWTQAEKEQRQTNL